MKFEHITAFTDADLNRWMELINAAYRGRHGAGRWTGEYELIAGKRIDTIALAAMIEDDHNDFIVTENAGQTLACINIHYQDGIAEFGCFAVDPHHHAEGYGSQILAYAENIAHNRVALLQVIVVAKNQSLIRYYEQRGYHHRGNRIPYPVDMNVGTPRFDDIDMLVLQKALP